MSPARKTQNVVSESDENQTSTVKADTVPGMHHVDDDVDFEGFVEITLEVDFNVSDHFETPPEQSEGIEGFGALIFGLFTNDCCKLAGAALLIAVTAVAVGFFFNPIVAVAGVLTLGALGFFAHKAHNLCEQSHVEIERTP